MIGAIVGDIIGSPYEGYGFKTKRFPLFDNGCRVTDDSVLTIATADVLLHGGTYEERYRDYCRRYPNAGYGGNFYRWAHAPEQKPYDSFGNGSAMRVGPIGLALASLDEVLTEARRSADPTHNHPEGVKGAQSTAAAIFLARHRAGKPEIRRYIEETFGYDLSPAVEAIRPSFSFDVTCQVTVPAALICFLESTGFEDAIRNAVSLGGDTDTQACIAGSVAEAFYGVPETMRMQALAMLTPDLRQIVDEFTGRFPVVS